MGVRQLPVASVTSVLSDQVIRPKEVATINNTPDQEPVRRWIEESCAQQGVPVKITDPEVIRKVVILLTAGRDPDGQTTLAREH